VRFFGRGRGDRYKRPSGDATRTGSTRVRAASNDDEAVNDVTLLLVAWDGEYTRRRVPSDDWAYKFCKRHGIRAYEAGVVGIPQHMRDYIKRQKARQERGES
jgi:hypothetical protein